MKWFYYKLLYKRRTVLLLDAIIRIITFKIRRFFENESSNIYKSKYKYASKKRNFSWSSKRNVNKIL